MLSGAVAENWSDAEGWAGQMEPFARVQKSADLIEGLTAFTEKREPRWTGR